MNKKNKSNSMDEYINVYKKIRIKNKNSRYIFRKNILEKKENFIKKNYLFSSSNSHYNSNLIQILKRKKQLSVNNSLSNSKKTILYHNKSSSRLANNIIENNMKDKTINKIH